MRSGGDRPWDLRVHDRALFDPAEGLTTFMADYAFKEDEGPEAAKSMRYGWLRDRQALPQGGEQALSSFRTRHHVASANVGYGKAAMLFLALRNRIGKENFTTALCQFWLHFSSKRQALKTYAKRLKRLGRKSIKFLCAVAQPDWRFPVFIGLGIF